MVRAFFAVELDSEQIKKKILATQKKIETPQTRIAFVSSENLHVTLKFLGEIDESLITTLAQKCKSIQKPKFTIELQGMGVLPNENYINALYIDISKGYEELQAIFHAIEAICSEVGIKKENRPFKSHLTIGRVKKIGNRQELVTKIAEEKKNLFGEFEVKQFSLKQSMLSPAGPIYSDLFVVTLV